MRREGARIVRVSLPTIAGAAPAKVGDLQLRPEVSGRAPLLHVVVGAASESWNRLAASERIIEHGLHVSRGNDGRLPTGTHQCLLNSP